MIRAVRPTIEKKVGLMKVGFIPKNLKADILYLLFCIRIWNILFGTENSYWQNMDLIQLEKNMTIGLGQQVSCGSRKVEPKNSSRNGRKWLRGFGKRREEIHGEK